MKRFRPGSRALIFSALLLITAVGSVAHAQADLSGTWGASSTPASSELAIQTAGPTAGRSIEISVVQIGGEIRVTEVRRAGSQERSQSYVLIPGQEQELPRFGRSIKVTVGWDGGVLVIEDPGKWRESWEVSGGTLTIRRENLNSGKQRTSVLNRVGVSS